MTKAKHTLVPWFVDRRDGDVNAIDVLAIDKDGNCMEIATVSTDGKITDGDRANAKLIAAAPDMYAALRPIAAAYHDDPGTSDLDNEQPVTITLGDVRKAWAALAKMA